MRLSRTDLVAVLTIVAGVGIGGLPTLSPRVLRSPAEDAPASADAVVPGQEVTIDLPDGSSMTGLAVAVLKRDGTKELAIFRGPRRLADVASDGTFEFDEDPLPVRIQMLAPGAEVRR